MAGISGIKGRTDSGQELDDEHDGGHEYNGGYELGG